MIARSEVEMMAAARRAGDSSSFMKNDQRAASRQTGKTDEDLIRACRAGDESAWQELVLRYQRLIYTIPRRAGLDEDAAGDVMQQVFATLVKYLDRIEQPAQIHAWLVTTARRETLRTLRRQMSGQVFSLDETDDDLYAPIDLPDRSPLPDELLIKLELEHRVRREVAALDEKCRALLTLLFYAPEPPSYAEIARLLSVSEGSVGPNRARCLQKLQNKMHQTGY